jgi:hypothetical protein
MEVEMQIDRGRGRGREMEVEMYKEIERANVINRSSDRV